MPITLNFVSAKISNYIINFQGQNYSVSVNTDGKVKIHQKTGTYKRYAAIKDAILNYHNNYACLN